MPETIELPQWEPIGPAIARTMRKHPTFNQGNFTSHKLGADGCLVEYRANTLAELEAAIGFVPVVLDPVLKRAPLPLTPSRRMYEWSFPLKPWQAEKILTRHVNALHSRFLDGDADLEQYDDGILSYLTQFQTAENVAGFLASVSDPLAEKTFCTRASAFSVTLRARCQEFVGDLPVAQIVETADQEAEIVVADEDRRNLPAIKKQQTKAAIIHGYEAHSAGKPGATDRLLQSVLSFLRTKLLCVYQDGQETCTNVDDMVQQAGIKIANQLLSFSGSGKQFYSWIDKVSYTTRMDAYAIARAEKALHSVPLEIESEEEPGTFIDNPVVREAALGEKFRESPFRELPESIQGTNLMICKLIRQKLSYAEIAETLSMSETAVSRRVARMRQANARKPAGVL